MPLPGKVLTRTNDKPVMVGDSITQVSIYYQSMASSIAGAFIGGQAPAPAFQNAGLNGARVSTFNDPTVRTNNLVPHFNDVGPMVIFLGVNDEFQVPATSDTQFRADYSALLAYITTNFTALRGIIMMSPWLIGYAARGEGPRDPGLESKTEIVGRLAHTYGAVFLNLRDRWFNDPNRPTTNPLVDQVHPNGVGATWLSEQVRGALEVRY